MRKTITAALAALTFGGAAMAAAAPASAAGWYGHGGYGGYHGGRGYGYGPAIFAGVAGLALGAALADNHPRYYGPAYYDGPGYGYARPYATCYSRRDVWDPYAGRYVVEHVPYGC